MKNHLLLITACVCMYAGGVSAQEKPAEVTKYTVMERFEPELILSAKEREQLKEERIAEVKRRREILDTLSISERKRERLLQDLIKDPFSNRLSRTMAEIEFEDEE
ncbi:hypothetical protein Q4603_09685 [Zobellia galactanivorans]|uniref:Conserved hypothetical periplasmic protein n=1 Tax=Zobellia galactanivorans (strain DSM 12802 / CCUG 47099 / CIP 106680 / NCIMB 13871 / Dsij) TaxID=63186 RepID=G0L3M6_ZOBGA|nr:MULTISPECIES: hypothetical protein [Zobellia]MBU3024823.1 hypothetical protein [Zobellia galactanivorans]MDO6808883.1 hypothetical protein [Zobellia galactanivorans]CAZ98514.1 Conserved hypothetical periplasmic protein [Zobellia galactanivorans]